MQLEEKIAKALERLQTPGIEGWGLHVHDDVFRLVGGEVIVTEPARGCTSETCHHVSHDPAAPVRRWIPPTGSQLIQLGYDQDGEDYITYYLVRPQDVFLKFVDERHYWKVLRVTERVPDWALAKLAEG